MRLRASYSHLGDIGGRKEPDGTAPAFGKCPAFLGCKKTGSGSRKSPQAFRHEHESEIFLREEVLDASDCGLLGTRKFDQSA